MKQFFSSSSRRLSATFEKKKEEPASSSSEDEDFPQATPPASRDSSQSISSPTPADEASQQRIDSAKEGTWTVNVHVLECRDLVSDDADGLCDPFVNVLVSLGAGKVSKGSTRVLPNERSPVFDELYSFAFDGVTRQDLDLASLTLSVMDEVRVGPSQQVGSADFDLLDEVYGREDHSLFRTFVCLSDEKGGSRGFVKVSIEMLGPGDKGRVKVTIDETAGKSGGAGTSVATGGPGSYFVPKCQMTELRRVVVKLHSIEDIVDSAFPLQLYCTVQLGSQSAATTAVPTIAAPPSSPSSSLGGSSRLAIINSSVSIPIQFPSMSQNLRICIFEKKSGINFAADRLIATFPVIKLQRVRSDPAAYTRRRVVLFGSPNPPSNILAGSDAAAKKMNETPDLASTFKGIACISVSEKKDGKKKVGPDKCKVKVIKPIEEALPLKEWVLKYHIYSCTVPSLSSSSFALSPSTKASWSLRLSLGPFGSTTSPARAGASNATCYWTDGPQVLRFRASPDVSQVPDVVVALVRSSDKMPICFRRIKVSELVLASDSACERSQQVEPEPVWHFFKEDKAIDAVSDAVFPGSALLKMGAYDAASVPKWKNESDSPGSAPAVAVIKLVPVVMKIDIYSGRNLPVADANSGSLDPFIRATVNGVTLQTRVKRDTRNPTFFETFVFDTLLPEDETLRPQILLQVWDRDEGLVQTDDFVGNVALSTSQKSREDGHCSRGWMPVFFQEAGDISQDASVYVGVRISKQNSASGGDAGSEMTSGRVERMPQSGALKTVQLIVLGCRNLLPLSGIIGLKKPLAKFKIGDCEEQETTPSNRPSALNCNFGEILTFKDCVIPSDPLFAPSIDVKIVDCLSLGATSLVGTGSLLLAFNEYYNRSQERAADAEIDLVRNPVADRSVVPWARADAEYMKDRIVLVGELDVTPLFNSFSIFRGKRRASGSPDIKSYDLVDAGKCAIFATISDDPSSDALSADIMKQINSPRRYRVRVYCLEVSLSTSRSTAIDPFLTVSVAGNFKKGEPLKKKVSPVELYQHFEVICKIPGDSTLRIDLTDWNQLGINELLGSTSIDLEERWFSLDWQKMKTKPIEHRNLFVRNRKTGTLSCWVDIEPLTTTEQKVPFHNITPPPSQEFELRVVVWKCENIPFGDAFSETSDMYVKLKLGQFEWQQTDVHFLARKGKGSFNFRFIIPLRLKSGGLIDEPRQEGAARLTIQVWDADIMISECLADAVLDLTDAFKKALALSGHGLTHQVFGKGKQLSQPLSKDSGETSALLGSEKKKTTKKKKKKSLWEEIRVALGLSAPENAKWVDLRSANIEAGGSAGPNSRVLMTIEILPSNLAQKRPCGPGREEPNRFPLLPPPEDRVDLTKMVNPFYAISTLCGDALARECGWRCYLAGAIVIFLAIGIVLGPEINILMSLLSILPKVVVGYIMLGLFASILLCCIWCCCCACKKEHTNYENDDEESLA